MFLPSITDNRVFRGKNIKIESANKTVADPEILNSKSWLRCINKHIRGELLRNNLCALEGFHAAYIVQSPGMWQEPEYEWEEWNRL